MPLLRSTPDRRRIDDWIVALASAGITAEVQRVGFAWNLYVAAEQLDEAATVLALFDQENAPQPAPAAAPVDFDPSPAGLLLAGVWLLAHPLTFLIGERQEWLRAGRSSAFHILSGEVWRAATGLMLHADAVHVVSNAVSGSIFVSAVCRIFGAGLGLWLTFAGGVLGNLINAFVRGAPHASIGASTAVFAAVGLLGGAQLVRRWQLSLAWKRVWLPLGATVGILAMLGAGPESDYLAHIFGMLSGLVLGAMAAWWRAEPIGERGQNLALLATVSAWTCAWVLALT